MKEIIIRKRARLSQGDIYKDVEFIEYAIEKAGVIEISKIVFPFVVVLTQDCDLNQDYTVRWSRKDISNQDKKIISVIVAPLYNEEHVCKGEHLSELGMTMAEIKSKTLGNNLRQNQTPRYHYLKFPKNVPIVTSVIDFKHYFTVNVEYLKKHKKENFICQIGPLYREAVSQRFSNYLSRIGLPKNETSQQDAAPGR
ncbi:MAG: hypothetical protein WAK60_07740 [Sedimentisphaerales bacterium]